MGLLLPGQNDPGSDWTPFKVEEAHGKLGELESRRPRSSGSTVVIHKPGLTAGSEAHTCQGLVAVALKPWPSFRSQ